MLPSQHESSYHKYLAYCGTFVILRYANVNIGICVNVNRKYTIQKNIKNYARDIQYFRYGANLGGVAKSISVNKQIISKQTMQPRKLELAS